MALYIVRSATDVSFLGGYRGGDVRRNDRFELRFTVDAGATVTVTSAGVFDARLDEDRAGGGHAPDEAGKQKDFVVLPPVLIPRAAWGAEPFRGTPFPLNNPACTTLTLHHAAGFGAHSLEEGLRQVLAIQDFHQNGRGWSDIGYQFVLDQNGRLYQGRPFLSNAVSFADGPPLALGAHVGGFNTGNIAVCALGCYHPPEGSGCRDEMTPAAVDSLVTLFAYLSERYGVAPENIRGHRDLGATSCPGDSNYALLGTIRSRVADVLQTGNRPLGTVALAATADAEGVVQVSWQFIEDLGIAGYQIERLYAGDEFDVVYTGEGGASESFADHSVSRPGALTYRLRARGGSGRTQILASANVVLERPRPMSSPTTSPTRSRLRPPCAIISTTTVS